MSMGQSVSETTVLKIEARFSAFSILVFLNENLGAASGNCYYLKKIKKT